MKIFKFSLFSSGIILIIIACGMYPQKSGEPIPNIASTESQNIKSPTMQRTDSYAEFNLSSANDVLPSDILEEVSFFGGGGGSYCYGLEPYLEPTITYDPTDEELMSRSSFVTCGWKKDETLRGAIQFPNGKIVISKVQTGEDQGSFYGVLELEPNVNDPIGLYNFTIEGETGILKSNAYIRAPDGPRLVQIEDSRIFLTGFLPHEIVRLVYYERNDKGDGTFAGWQEYQVDRMGQLEIMVSLPRRDDLVVVGPLSGEVHLFHLGPFGGSFDFIGESILEHSSDTVISYSREHYLDCPSNIASRSRLHEAMKAYIVGNESFLFANPRQDARVILGLSVGTEIFISSGTYCSGNLMWWKAYPDQIGGYIVEFDGKSYYLEP